MRCRLPLPLGEGEQHSQTERSGSGHEGDIRGGAHHDADHGVYHTDFFFVSFGPPKATGWRVEAASTPCTALSVDA